MPEEFLEACLRDDTAQAEATIGLNIAPVWLQEKSLMAIRLDDCRSDPAYVPWSLRAMGLRQSGDMVGHIGFHSRPNPEYLHPFVPDGIEFGYTVFSEHRGQGYALEAIRGLLNWAAEKHAIRNFVVSIAPENTASTALAKKLGFVKVGEHQDEVDGLEIVYLLSGEALARSLAAAQKPLDQERSSSG
jgi:RimJ/RimL family protein N-acetyltransferase